MDYRTAKQGWQLIGGKKHFFRSQWEVYYARYLQYMKEMGTIHDWLYEPETFWFESIKRGVRSYKPDFKVICHKGHYWAEVKGYMDPKSLTKIKRFRKYYPQERIEIIDNSWFAKNIKIFTEIFYPLVPQGDG